MQFLRRRILKLAGKESHSREVSHAVLQASRLLARASMAETGKILADLQTGEEGLDQAEARDRLETYGKNKIDHEKAPAWYRQLVSAFINPFVGVLVLLAIASFLTEYVFAPPGEQNVTALIIISTLVLISVLLAFIQEYKAGQAAAQLMSLIQNRAMVQRKETGRQELPTTDLVPGDIVFLSAGDIIPADLRILSANNLSINEAALTGESLPVEKNQHPGISGAVNQPATINSANAFDLQNIGFMGTNIVSGTAKAVVIATGNDTYFGSMSKQLVGHHPPTSFDMGIKNVSVLLIRFMLIMVPIIFLISGFVQGNWFQALLFGLAVAVGLTPEMLPTIITANLAKGTMEMARKKTIVKRLNAIQNLGAMDVLCTDKTGTLTEDRVAMVQYVDCKGETDERILPYLYLNSFFQTGLKNPLDEAVLENPQIQNIAGLEQKFKKIDEIPFQTVRRRMSVIVENSKGEHILICKGAVKEMVSLSVQASAGDRNLPLSSEKRNQIMDTAEKMTHGGLRVLVLAKKICKKRAEHYRIEDEKDLTLLGLIGFLDPAKATAGPALKALQSQGVRVCVITGDNAIATRRTCREIGFSIQGLLEGNDIDALNDQGLQEAVEENNVFVRMAPLQKSRVLNTIKKNGHTAGFLGDGINDAPALRDADVGISVDNAVDIAKESADIILLEKSLMVLKEGISRGRQVFGNIMKYIKMTVSSNFGNVFSVLVASIFIPFPPMLPLHLLVQNLLYDFSQISIPWDHVDEEYMAKPQKWNPKSIAQFTLFVGPVSSIFDFTTFALLWFVFGASSSGQQSLFQTGWFVLGLLSQTMVVHIIRTRKIPFIQSTAATPVLVMTSLVMAAGLVLPFTGVGQAMGFQALPLPYFFWLFLTLAAYFGLMQAVKVLYIRRFKRWL